MKKSAVISLLLLLTALICGAAGILMYIRQQHAGGYYEEIREEVRCGPGEETAQIPVDFAALQKQNPDVYAWITIPDTEIDYPILQSPEDNRFYLEHSIDGSESAEGCIFTENFNSKDFEDPNTVIYGHNMKNGSMFGGLHDYRDRDFFDQNREVMICTPDAVRRYEIFAAYFYDDRHILESFDFDDPWIYRQYLNRIFAIRDMNACIDRDIDVGVEDRIITLSTCYGAQHDVRFLVQAVLLTIEK